MQFKVAILFLTATLTISAPAATPSAQEVPTTQTIASKHIDYKNWIKLATSLTFLGFSARFIANAFKYNECPAETFLRNPISELIYMFFHGDIGKQLVYAGSDRNPHLPLIAASGAIFALSIQQTFAALNELFPEKDPKPFTPEDYKDISERGVLNYSFQ